ncbi:MAG: signal peptide peptidase SppA, partial [Myxococcales bacterium]
AGSWTAAGGAWVGDRGGYYGGLALRDYRDDGLQGRHVVKIRLESTPGDRGHARLLATLWRLAAAPEVAGVVFQLKAEPASSGAHAEEMGDALRMLRSRGKKVLCHLDEGGGRALHVCSQADRIVVNPAGGVRFSGARSQYIYLGGLLQKLGVQAEFVRVAEHKTAPEQFTERGPTPTAEDDHRDLLVQTEAVLLHDVGGGRRLSVPELRDRLARGPFTAPEARAAGLIDGVAHDDELTAAMAEVVGERLPLLPPDASPALAPRPADVMGSRDRIALVYIDGDMVDGRSRSVPLAGNRLAGSYTIAAALQQARADSRVRAVVLRLETPGGSSLAADVLWREVYLTARVKPVIASMGSTAASAGYYVASAAGQIFASRSTVTGSIGIYYGKADVSALLGKLGLNVVTYRTAPHADADSIFRPFTDEERTQIGGKIKHFYDVFVDRVSRGRKLTPEQVDAVARGKVWTGAQAHERRLVDRLGGLREALAEARHLGHLPPD